MMSNIDTYYIKEVLTDEKIPFEFRDNFIQNIDLFVNDRDEFIKIIGEKQFDEFVTQQFAKTVGVKAREILTRNWLASGGIEYLLAEFYRQGDDYGISENIVHGCRMTLKFEVIG